MLSRDGNHDDIVAFLSDRNLPGDEIVYNALADEIMQTPPMLGYLTSSLERYTPPLHSRIAGLDVVVSGIHKIV